MNQRTTTTARGAWALTASLALLTLTACGGSDGAEGAGGSSEGGGSGRTIVVGTSNDAPFSFHDAGSSELKGIDGQMITAIAEEKGWTIEIYDTDFSTLIPALQADKIDVVVDAMYITDERKEQVAFTDPWYKEGEGIVVRDDETGISSAADLAGKVIGAQTGTVYLDYAQTLGGSEVQVLDSQAALLQSLKNGQLDAVVTDSAVAGYAIAQDPSSGLELVLPDPPHFPGTIGAAVRKEDTELLAELNDGLKTLKDADQDLSILQDFGLDESNRQ